MSTQTIPNLATPNTANNYLASKAITSATADTAGAFTTVLGRLLFSVIFFMAAPFHFTQTDINYAIAAGVPFAKFMVPASGALALVGALSILLGYRAKLGAWLLVLFLVPVTLMMHNFWAVKDAAAAQIQMVMFMKNVSILGGALLISQFGAGRWSLDARRQSHSA